MTEKSTVRSVTFDLLRSLRLTAVFGNPGSTEQPFLQEFPADLGNREATTMPKPWVKWSYWPARAEDVPEAFMRAYAMALQPPAGPVYLSVPMDDWKQPMPGPARVRFVSDRVAPDTERLR